MFVSFLFASLCDISHSYFKVTYVQSSKSRLSVKPSVTYSVSKGFTGSHISGS